MSYTNRNSASLSQRLKYKWSMCRAHAAERNITFTLTFDEFRQMWMQQRGKCGYSNRRMFLTIGRGFIYRNASMSLERLDPTVGYTSTNCILVRYDSNRRKGKRNFFDHAFMEDFHDYVVNALTFRPDLNTLAA